jgi:hypothetical protein
MGLRMKRTALILAGLPIELCMWSAAFVLLIICMAQMLVNKLFGRIE